MITYVTYVQENADQMRLTDDTGKTGDAGVVLLTAQRCQMGTVLSKGSADLGIASHNR